MATTLNNKELTAILLNHIANCGGGTTPTPGPGYEPTEEGYAAMLASWSSIATALKNTLTTEDLYATTVAGTTITADNAWYMFTIALTDALNHLEDTKITLADLNLAAFKAEVLEASRINVASMLADYIKASDVVASSITTEVLLATTASFMSMISNVVSTQGIQSFSITSDHITIADAFIKNAMIESVSAGKINTGTIDTNKVVIRSQDGNIKIDKAQMIVTDDDDVVRVLIGKTSDNDYTLTLWDADGNCIWDASGIHRDAIKEAIIDDAAVLPNANISASKLNITSLVNSLNSNGGIRTSAANITIDADNHTLASWFNTMDTWQDGLLDRVSEIETELTTVDGKIATMVTQSDIATLTATVNGAVQTVEEISDSFTSLEQTVNGFDTRIESLSTTVESIDLDSYVTEADLGTYLTEDDLEDLTERTTTLENNYTTISATVSGISSSVSSHTSSISELGTKVATVDAKFDDYTFVSESKLEETIADYASQVTQTAESITTTVTANVQEYVDDSFVQQTQYDKWFSESVDGLRIGSSDSPVILELSNDGIKFFDTVGTSEKETGFWDGSMFHSRNIKVDVEYTAQFGAFEWAPKSDGTLILRRV